MASFDDLVRELPRAMDDAAALTKVYSSLLEKLFGLPLWSVATPEGRRIPWREAHEAKDALGDAFGWPGLYIFGSQEVPLYIGQTTSQTLWERISGRYVGGPQSQCQLAAAFERQVCNAGVEGFPERIRKRRSRVRLSQAAAFARQGIDTIWFTLLPMEDESVCQSLEKRLIHMADMWNLDRGYPPLLNVQHT